MKKLKKSLVLFVLVLSYALLLALSAFADELEVPDGYETANLMNLDRQQNVLVQISYDKEKPDIYMITPYGDVLYPGKSSNEDIYLKYSDDGLIAYYYLPGADSGQWQIAYKKKSNTKLEVKFTNYTNGIWVKSFEVSGLYDGSMKVKFESQFDKDDWEYRYEIYAVTLDENGSVDGQKKLYDDYAYTNKKVETSFDVSLESYDQYYFMIKMFITEYDIELSDSYTTKTPVKYKNPSDPDSIEDAYVYVNPLTGDIDVDWSDWSVYCDEYIVSLFADGASEPFYYTTTTDNRISLPGDSEAKSITLEIRYKSYDGLSEALSKTFGMAQLEDLIEISTLDYSNCAQVTLSYDLAHEINAQICVNDKDNPYEVELSAKTGTLSFALENGSNVITVSYGTINNIFYRYEKELVTDLYAPSIKLYERIDNLKVSENSFVIIGETEPGAKLEINDVEYTVDENGQFKAEVALIAGDNAFNICATDAAGNRSAQNVTLKCVSEVIDETGNLIDPESVKFSIWDYIPLGIVLVLGILLVVIVISTYEMNKKITKVYASVAAIRNMSLMIAAYAGGGAVYTFIERGKAERAVTGYDFLELAKTAFEEAYSAVVTYQAYKTLFTMFITIAIIASAVCVCLIITTLVMRKVKKAKADKDAGIVKQKKEKKLSKKELAAKEAEIKELTETKSKKVTFCPKCGAQMDDGSSFCGQCGYKA